MDRRRSVGEGEANKAMSALGIAVLFGVVLLVVAAFVDRVLVPLQARRSVEKILKSKVRHDPRALENPKYGTVVGDTDSLRFRSAKGRCFGVAVE